MTSDKAKKIKAIVKGTAPKSTFGTNPNDPWSAKYNVAESNDLDRYLKSRGINPAFVSKDTKIAHSKSGEFAKWKQDHQFEEVQAEQTLTARHTPTEIRQHELKKRVHKHNEIGGVKSEAWDQPDYEQSIKARQAEADKKAKEQSKEGVKKLLNKYYTHNKKEHHMEEVEHVYGGSKDKKIGEVGKDRDGNWYAKHHTSNFAASGFTSRKDAENAVHAQHYATVNEEVEQIDELKKSTLASYTQKASADMSNREFAAGQRSGRGEGSVVTDPDIKKSRKRYVGIIKATHKLAKEETKGVNEMDYGNDDNSPPYDGHGYPKGQKPKGPDVYVKKAQKIKDVMKNAKKTLDKILGQQKEEIELDEGKMGDLAGEIGRHLDKHIDDYKTHGGAEHLGYKTIDTAKKIVKSHGLHPNHAQKFVNDYVEKRLAEENIGESDVWKGVSKVWPGIGSSRNPEKEKQFRANIDSAILDAIRAKEAKEKKLKGEQSDMCPVCGQTSCNCTHIWEDKFGKPTPSLEEIAKKHKISMEELKKAHEEGVKIESEHTDNKQIASEIARDHLNERPDYYKKLKQYVEDVYQDSQAATQTSFDMGTSTDDTVQNRKRQLSKSARMIKSLYKKHRVNEDTYDYEKDDKSVASYGKKPKFEKDNGEGNDPDAVAVLSGGKTLTGVDRDTIEIDPKMKTRPNQPEVDGRTDQDKKKDKQ